MKKKKPSVQDYTYLICIKDTKCKHRRAHTHARTHEQILPKLKVYILMYFLLGVKQWNYQTSHGPLPLRERNRVLSCNSLFKTFFFFTN